MVLKAAVSHAWAAPPRETTHFKSYILPTRVTVARKGTAGGDIPQTDMMGLHREVANTGPASTSGGESEMRQLPRDRRQRLGKKELRQRLTTQTQRIGSAGRDDPLWSSILSETRQNLVREPALASFLHAAIMAHDSLGAALAFHLANKLGSPTLMPILLRELFLQVYEENPELVEASRKDIVAVIERDPACRGGSQCLHIVSRTAFGRRGGRGLPVHWLIGSQRCSM
jgi:hypothetical protein